MLVTLTSRGAAVARIELNSPLYCDIDHRNGYLGHLVVDAPAAGKGGNGCLVQVVGPGTPAAVAGLKPGDFITKIGNESVVGPMSLETALENTRPNRKIQIQIVRNGQQKTLQATLRRIPLEVIKPEDDDAPSMLLTLQQLDDSKIADDEKAEKAKWDAEDKERKKGTDVEEAQLKANRRLALSRRELAGLNLRSANWEVVPSADKNVAKFCYKLPEKDIEVTKTYRLAEVPKEQQKDANFKAYHLEFEIEIRNVASESHKEAHKVAYRLDGPNGLPTEGVWYSTGRVTRCGGMGFREFIVSLGGETPTMEDAVKIAEDKDSPLRPESPNRLLTFIGVDAQYFSAVLLPQRGNPAAVWFDDLVPIHVGKVDPKHANLSNTSCRLVSTVKNLKPGETMTHNFQFFAGPKKAAVLEPYALGELIYFGWPIYSYVAVPLTHILHWFFAVVGNYGLAIIMLTVFVRGCMFPLSLKQAAGAENADVAAGTQEDPGKT